MTSITDIPFGIIKDFLLENGIKLPKTETKTYDLAKDIILNSQAEFYPDTIIDWIIAHNFSLSGKQIKLYTLNEINNLSKKELSILSVKLGLDNDDEQSIINVLSYLHKIKTINDRDHPNYSPKVSNLQLLPDEVKFADLLPKLGLNNSLYVNYPNESLMRFV
jgi:hypothetical protein